MTDSRRGVLLVLLSALAFGTSGPFARALMDAGWTPGAAVLVRITGAAVVLGAMTALLWREHLRRALRTPGVILVYGAVGVAGVQLCYFSAVRTLSVSVALLLEYLAPVLVVAWLWMRTGRRPSRCTLLGGALALAGAVALLDVTGDARIDTAGVLWALAAAAGLACYFLVMGRDSQGADPIHPAVLATTGMFVGSAAVAVAAVTGVFPVEFGTTATALAGHPTPVWVPVSALVLGSTVLAYLAGAAGLARVGATMGSLINLSELLFAVIAAWLLLDQWPTPPQLLGAVLVVAGVVLARTGDRRPVAEPAAALA
ncbi:MAG: EamA family transporter [Actinomycetota bacterium]|nr:EamA family transporter [Actinomycetota bacterium]